MQILSDVLTGNNQAPLTKSSVRKTDLQRNNASLYNRNNGVANPWVKIEARNVKKEIANK